MATGCEEEQYLGGNSVKGDGDSDSGDGFEIGIRERGGVVVERQTPNREVLGSIPTSGTVLCP